jgi:hypothetical protein
MKNLQENCPGYLHIIRHRNIYDICFENKTNIEMIEKLKREIARKSLLFFTQYISEKVDGVDFFEKASERKEKTMEFRDVTPTDPDPQD